MRLIDADELINNINQDIEAFERLYKNYFSDGVICGLTLSKKMIKKAPTVASDENIKNFTIYNYPLKPGCTLLTDDDKDDSGLLEEGEE